MKLGQRGWRRVAHGLLAAAAVVVVADVATCFATYAWERHPADWALSGGCFYARVSDNLIRPGGFCVWPRDTRIWWWRYGYENISGRFIVHEYHLPLWFMWAPATGLGVLAWMRARRLGDAQTCAKCGYSLAGLTVGTACPECGRRAG